MEVHLCRMQQPLIFPFNANTQERKTQHECFVKKTIRFGEGVVEAYKEDIARNIVLVAVAVDCFFSRPLIYSLSPFIAK